MGDRCYLNVTVRDADKPAFAEFFEMTVEDLEGCWEVEEANYGLYEELTELAAKGCVFIGWHTSGGEYGSAEFCGIGGECSFHETLHEGYLAMACDIDGNPMDGRLERAREHAAAYNEAKALVEDFALSKEL